MRNVVTKINELPEDSDNWTHLLRFKFVGLPDRLFPDKLFFNNEFKVIKMDCLSDYTYEHIFYEIDRDFLKARVLDEMWSNLDIDLDSIQLAKRTLQDASTIGTSNRQGIIDNFNKIIKIASIRHTEE